MQGREYDTIILDEEVPEQQRDLRYDVFKAGLLATETFFKLRGRPPIHIFNERKNGALCEIRLFHKYNKETVQLENYRGQKMCYHCISMKYQKYLSQSWEHVGPDYF